MRNREFFKRVSDRTGVPETDIDIVVRGMRDELLDISVSRETVNMKGFGIFYFRERKEKRIKSLENGSMKTLSKRAYMFFKVSSDFNKVVNAKSKNGPEKT